jgi:putative membrane protein
MKNQLTTEFQTRLWQAVKAIEQDSQAEVVVVLRSSSDSYAAIPLVWGLCAAWLGHTYMIYAPDFFETWLVYYIPIFAFAISYSFAHLPWIKRISSKKKTLQKKVEIMARALFQKGGVQHTCDKTGVLIYCSFLEQIVTILPDRGLEMAIPEQEWQVLRHQFNQIFTDKKPVLALLSALQHTQVLFASYLPVQDGDINELPDVMEIDL